MNDSIQTELKQVKRDLIITQIVGAPGLFLLGLALYGLFGANGNAFHPALNDPQTCYVMLGLGGGIWIWEFLTIMKLARRQAALNKQLKA